MPNLIGFFIAAFTVLGLYFVVGQDNDFADVIKKCESKDENTRLNAIIALGDFPDQLPKVAPLVCRLTSSLDHLESTAATIALENIGPDILPHVQDLLRSSDPVIIDGACNAFALYGKQTSEVASGLFELVKSDDEKKIFSGLKALQGMEDTAVPVLDRVIELLRHSNFNIQLRACNVLTAIGADAEPGLDALLDIVENGNTSVKSSAAITLGSIGKTSDDPRILAALTKKLAAYTALEKERTLEGISLMGVRAKSLIKDVEILMTDKRKSVMPEAAYTFWKIGGDYDQVKSVLDDCAKRPTYQARVLIQLEKLGDSAVGFSDFAIESLSSQEPTVRELAAIALGRIKIENTNAALTQLHQVASSDKDMLIRNAAKQAIVQIEERSKHTD